MREKYSACHSTVEEVNPMSITTKQASTPGIEVQPAFESCDSVQNLKRIPSSHFGLVADALGGFSPH